MNLSIVATNKFENFTYNLTIEIVNKVRVVGINDFAIITNKEQLKEKRKALEKAAKAKANGDTNEYGLAGSSLPESPALASPLSVGGALVGAGSEECEIVLCTLAAPCEPLQDEPLLAAPSDCRSISVHLAIQSGRLSS